jgi:RNA recognition motif-containing protein
MQQSPRRAEQPFEKRKPQPAPADGSVEIYVGNLSYDMTEDQLRAEFEAFGKVNSTRLVMNRFNGKSKGFGFVQMPNREEADKAVAALNDKELMGRHIKCNEAKNLI